jgi:predicted enzyme related to lactoylglutathione lyase
MGSNGGESHPVFRHAGISYLRMPAPDPHRAAAFYRNVFGWKVDDNRTDPSFEDGTGHVIGHFMSDLPVAGEAGPTLYIYVEQVTDVLKKITENGGQIAAAPYPEGDLWVATFTDPAGNRLGVWQRGPLD